jgi:prepilin-type N-terminal cleavage/methylation domain-containing protein
MMNLKKIFNKFSGFTLMEILLALFIIGILLLVTIPIVSDKLARSDEYSYYLAYRSLEKMAGHIVALGDPQEDEASLEQPIVAQTTNSESFIKKISSKYSSKYIKKYFASLGYKFAYSELYIFQKIFPKAVAGINTTSVGSWDSDTFDELWLTARVCSGNKVKKYCEEKTKTLEDGSHEKYEECTYYSSSDPSISCPSSANELDDFLSMGADCEYSTSDMQSLYNYLASQERPNASSYCNSTFKSKCGISTSDATYTVTYNVSADDNEDDEPDDGEEDYSEEKVEGATYYDDLIVSASPGSCNLSRTSTYSGGASGSSVTAAVTPTFSSSWCTEHNFVNMTNQAATSSIDCVCKSGMEQTENNEKVCFTPCSSTKESLYAVENDSGYSRLCCSTDFNPTSGTCCPENSNYDDASKSCVCKANYEDKGSGCKLARCSAGSHISSDGYCIANPPIVRAQRFCELIASNWNISSSYCTFGAFGGAQANSSVYGAAKGTDNIFLSIQSRDGAFASITPNIVLDNGLKLWILSDKQASIYGLSYYSDTAYLNMCSRIKLTDYSQSACENAGGYYCKSQASCFKLTNSDNDMLRDARNCCPSFDMDDVQTAAEEQGLNWKRDPQAYAVSGFTVFVDINGSKGTSTLWEDVFPFFISSNGTVYPAYPLNAPKGLKADDGGKLSTALYTAGNSDKFLPADVYYNQSVGDSLKRIVPFPSVSYARALCSARNLSQYTPYCLNLGDKYTNTVNSTKLTGVSYLSVDDSSTSTNPCDSHTCYVVLKKKRMLW